MMHSKGDGWAGSGIGLGTHMELVWKPRKAPSGVCTTSYIL